MPDEVDVYDDGEGTSRFDDDRREFAELVAGLHEVDADPVSCRPRRDSPGSVHSISSAP
ncbi:hypothetical protein [Salinigranum salinum]|uniref:hypothetical protein n=1 Tax=Salinigranum salinum TaxID=1364937 RepID=UPI001864507C|nr:hypothetical protein [Salinigranum salinum]